MSDVKRWLAVYAGEGVVHLFPVDPPSCGPDVFVKLADYDAKCGEVAALEAKLAEAERDAARKNTAVQNVMAMLADWLDDDKFNTVESNIIGAGFTPPELVYG